ncbi:hypothetical protein C6N75_12855 [Streptomyces solincola]|uniref:Uncharacterized protein n=1 Tax=Streptomyces solincola TaxID=2100817 RepID=A0A2S9PWM9_9ACTN|nr:hypothetical protein [Streptomyces solincola]PRH78836.1 hypothetical protein C6N75_12855 [Streptomyces solincola]
MTTDRAALTALHLLLTWATMTGAAPAVGIAVFLAGWGGGAGAALATAAVGVPLTVGVLVLAGTPARSLVPLCGTARGRFGWAVAVLLLGTLGVPAGAGAYLAGVDLGSADVRVALTGVPYAVAAALFVADRWVRLAAVAVVATGVVYGGVIGR